MAATDNNKWKGFADVEKSLDDSLKPKLNKYDKFLIWLSDERNKRNFKIGSISALVILFIGLWIGLLSVPVFSKKPINAYSRDHNSGTYEVFVEYGLNGDSVKPDNYYADNGAPIFNKYVRTADNNTQIVSSVDKYEDTIGYSSSVTVSLYDNVRTLKFYWDYDSSMLNSLSLDKFIDDDNDGIYFLPPEIDPKTGSTKSTPYKSEFFYSIDTNNNSKIDENDLFLTYPTTEAVKGGYYSLARNFHIFWMGENFYDMSINDVFDPSTWPTLINPSQEELDEAFSFAFFLYVVFGYDSPLHQSSIDLAGLYGRPSLNADSSWASKGIDPKEITNWMISNNMLSSDRSGTIKIQGSASTTYSISVIFQTFVAETGANNVILDQGNSVGSSSAFNSNVGVYIGTQSRSVTVDELNKTYESQDSTSKGSGLIVQTNSSGGSDYYNYFSFGTDSLEIIVNSNIDNRVSYITPEILREIYLGKEGMEWSEVIKVYYEI
ncbi:MAG: hypothetical protein HRS57_00820 [Mycoplasmataceae bacterium]|nr:hypothetical protein [Mycoplasmataceae bacterium]